ncbi:hypothetical protein L1787_12680 [Acuticoccus sp. M5D2P5]|uniref:hypothetical protein n=1 Tax=Acuticoccus kalidii TaxID=2910977 RepID=UPI001F29F086|nr:hypothetical protein [Acuticoccus kalidii]MCF3934264.1 hypothetical protein [Acuticoccus kalidii]
MRVTTVARIARQTARPIAVALLPVIVLAFAAAPAEARPDTRTMTCEAVNGFIQKEGAVVMTTGRYTFRRFVANRAYCDPWQWAQPEYAPTRDTPKCPVFGVCYDPPIDFHTFD